VRLSGPSWQHWSFVCRSHIRAEPRPFAASGESAKMRRAIGLTPNRHLPFLRRQIIPPLRGLRWTPITSSRSIPALATRNGKTARHIGTSSVPPHSLRTVTVCPCRQVRAVQRRDDSEMGPGNRSNGSAINSYDGRSKANPNTNGDIIPSRYTDTTRKAKAARSSQ
jgi:hypothetical protein